jgi:hypothetical protein
LSTRTQLAHAILTLASAGAPVPEVLADELARTVLSDPKVAAAQAVAEGGPHKLLRAIELAEMVGAEVRHEERRRGEKKAG